MFKMLLILFIIGGLGAIALPLLGIIFGSMVMLLPVVFSVGGIAIGVFLIIGGVRFIMSYFNL